MELLIRSQDKYTLLKCNNKITIIDGTGIKEALRKSLLSPLADMEQMKTLKDGWCLSCDDLILGTYKTRERALEVLDEIRNAILCAGAGYEEIKEIKKEFKSWSATNTKTGVVIYEMPIE